MGVRCCVGDLRARRPTTCFATGDDRASCSTTCTALVAAALVAAAIVAAAIVAAALVAAALVAAAIAAPGFAAAARAARPSDAAILATALQNAAKSRGCCITCSDTLTRVATSCARACIAG